jgi:hypothetical protein
MSELELGMMEFMGCIVVLMLSAIVLLSIRGEKLPSSKSQAQRILGFERGLRDLYIGDRK